MTRMEYELDSEDAPQFGLAAKQVAEVAPSLVTRDGQGKAYAVRYEELGGFDHE